MNTMISRHKYIIAVVLFLAVFLGQLGIAHHNVEHNIELLNLSAVDTDHNHKSDHENELCDSCVLAKILSYYTNADHSLKTLKLYNSIYSGIYKGVFVEGRLGKTASARAPPSALS